LESVRMAPTKTFNIGITSLSDFGMVGV